jgi:hypothetical protein
MPVSQANVLISLGSGRTTRLHRPHQRRSSCVPFVKLTGATQCASCPASLATPDAAASTASHSACLTIAIRPSYGTRRP